MRFAYSSLGIAMMVLALGACDDDPGASIEITDARTHRAADNRVDVEVDLLAQERLGRNIGTYCTRVTFAGQANFVEQCSADLADGDSKTIRFTSDGDLADEAAITIRVRLANVDVGRTLEAPGH